MVTIMPIFISTLITSAALQRHALSQFRHGNALWDQYLTHHRCSGALEAMLLILRQPPPDVRADRAPGGCLFLRLPRLSVDTCSSLRAKRESLPGPLLSAGFLGSRPWLSGTAQASFCFRASSSWRFSSACLRCSSSAARRSFSSFWRNSSAAFASCSALRRPARLFGVQPLLLRHYAAPRPQPRSWPARPPVPRAPYAPLQPLSGRLRWSLPHCVSHRCASCAPPR